MTGNNLIARVDFSRQFCDTSVHVTGFEGNNGHRGGRQWQARVRRQGYPPVTKSFNKIVEATRWTRLVESDMNYGAYESREEAEITSFAEALDRYSKEIRSVTGCPFAHFPQRSWKEQ